MTYEEYAALDGLRWSHLKAMRVSPKQFRYESTHDREDTAYFRVGRAMHACALEPDTFLERYTCYRDGIRRGRAWDAFQAANSHMEILNADEMERAVCAAHAVLTHPVAARYLAQGVREDVVQWTDAATGIRCKGRVDHWNGHLVDLKSTSRIEQRIFATAAARLGYHGQLAYYSDGLAASGIVTDPEPIIVAVQSEAPYDVVVYRMPEHVVEQGRKESQRLIMLLKVCLERDSWPGIAGDEVLQLELPEWAMASDDLELTVGGERIEGL